MLCCLDSRSQQGTACARMVNEDGLAGQLRTAQDTFIVMSVPQSSTE